jgi:phenylacetate-CoA ligase
MARISGRSDDMLIIRGVNVFPTQIEELLFQVPGLTPHYELELTRAVRLDALTVNVECAPAPAFDEGARLRLGQELTALIKNHVGISATVQVRDPGTLERSVGKARRVVDHRNN